MAEKEHDALFVSGKAKWLLDHARELTPDQRALLLAVANLEQSQGRTLSTEDRKAIDKLVDMQEGYDPSEIEQAVQHMIQAKTKRKVVDWPSGIWQKIRKKKST
jgi:C4-dicarboxylate-specific signal transduction histidine kinase